MRGAPRRLRVQMRLDITVTCSPELSAMFDWLVGRSRRCPAGWITRSIFRARNVSNMSTRSRGDRPKRETCQHNSLSNFLRAASTSICFTPRAWRWPRCPLDIFNGDGPSGTVGHFPPRPKLIFGGLLSGRDTGVNRCAAHPCSGPRDRHPGRQGRWRSGPCRAPVSAVASARDTIHH